MHFDPGLMSANLLHPLDGVTNQKNVAFLNNEFFSEEKKALAFDWDRCYHLALCL